MQQIKTLSENWLAHSSKKWRVQSLYIVISLTISLLVYAAVLILGVPKEIGEVARSGFTTAVVAIILLLYAAYRWSGWTGTLASLCLTLLLFALPLTALWNSGMSDGYLIGGLLPWSDASGYYWEARRLLEGQNFSEWGSRRPLFPALLAPLLGLTNQNLQLTLAILVAITAIACFLAAREVQRSHGTAAGVMLITILFLFYRLTIGQVMTENLGLALSAVGFALLWRGAWQQQIKHCVCGIFLLTLALNARAGAFFILPVLILWGAWSFRGTTRFSWRFLLGGTSAVLLGFLLNSILNKIIGAPDAIAFSNFSYTLYGLIVGSNWTQVLKNYPELSSLSDSEAARRIYDLAFEALRANPLGLVTGCLRAWDHFLFKDYVFSFISNLKGNFLLQLLSVIALFHCYRQRQEPHNSLLIAATFGILLSVPFAPPWDGGIRVYAATLPFFSVLPALGFETLARGLKSPKLIEASILDNSPQFLISFSSILAVFIFVAPITTKVFSHVPQFSTLSCPEGTEAVYLRVISGSSINLVADNSLRTTHLPDVRLSDFKEGLTNLAENGYPDLAKELANLGSSTTIMNAFDLNSFGAIWLITDSNKMPKEKGIVGICGKFSEANGLFYAKS